MGTLQAIKIDEDHESKVMQRKGKITRNYKSASWSKARVWRCKEGAVHAVSVERGPVAEEDELSFGLESICFHYGLKLVRSCSL